MASIRDVLFNAAFSDKDVQPEQLLTARYGNLSFMQRLQGHIGAAAPQPSTPLAPKPFRFKPPAILRGILK